MTDDELKALVASLAVDSKPPHTRNIKNNRTKKLTEKNLVES